MLQLCKKFPNATQFGETARKIYSDLTDSTCQIVRIHPFAVPLFDSYVDWERSAFPIELVKKEPSGAGNNARALTSCWPLCIFIPVLRQSLRQSA